MIIACVLNRWEIGSGWVKKGMPLLWQNSLNCVACLCMLVHACACLCMLGGFVVGGVLDQAMFLILAQWVQLRTCCVRRPESDGALSLDLHPNPKKP